VKNNSNLARKVKLFWQALLQKINSTWGSIAIIVVVLSAGFKAGQISEKMKYENDRRDLMIEHQNMIEDKERVIYELMKENIEIKSGVINYEILNQNGQKERFEGYFKNK